MKITIHLLFLLLFLSCQKKRLNSYEIDCNHEKKQAQNDFKYKNYTYFSFEGFGFGNFGQEEFILLLNAHKIKHNSVLMSCIVDERTDFENCYAKEMNRLLNDNFGKHFFDSLKIQAKQEYVLKNRDSIFHYEECDQTSRHPKTNDYNTQFKLDDKEYFQQFKYPKNYIKRKNDDEKYSYTSTSFILMKDRTTKNFQTESSFENSKNKIFEASFNKSVGDFVKKINWKPATIEGVPVNSYMDITITYE